MRLDRITGWLAAAGLMVMITTGGALAQVSGKAFEGFRGNSSDPIQIEADELQVIDGQARAIFKGRVRVRQGKSTITTDKLVVHYAKGGNGGQNDIEKLELFGNLIATSEENTASSDNGVYNVKSEDILLTGNVVVSQGANVATGCTLVANLRTNVAQIKACKGEGGRVSAKITPGSN